MKNNDLDEYEEFAILMKVLGEIYDPPSDEKIEVYYRLLADYSISEIKRGFDALLKQRTTATFPKPAEIIKAIEGDPQDKAIIAWGALEKALSSVGSYRSVQFGDPVIHSIIKFWGGWPKCCAFLVDELKWKQKEFITLYGTFEKKGDHPELCEGLIAQTNSRRQIDQDKWGEVVRQLAEPEFVSVTPNDRQKKITHNLKGLKLVS